ALRAHRAQMLLTAAPKESIPFLKDHLRPPRSVDAKRVEALVAELDDKRFAVREAASTELATMVDQIEPSLTRLLEKSPSAEVGRRVAAVLAAPYRPPTGEELRMLRVIATLEGIGSPQARDVLRELARGEPARATREAKESLERLKFQPTEA